MTDYETVLTGIVAFLMLVIAFLTYRLRATSMLLQMPYLRDPRPTNGTSPTLAGEHADKWEIVSAKIRKPRHATFLEQQAEYDECGSIVYGQAKEIGRTMDGPIWDVYVRSPSWPCSVEFKVALRSSPKIKRSLTTLWRQ